MSEEATYILFWFLPATTLTMAYVATTLLEWRWRREMVPLLRDVLRQIRGEFGEPLFAIDGRNQVVVGTLGWLHFVPRSGAVESVPLTKIVSLNIWERSRRDITFRCDLGSDRYTPEFVTNNIVGFTSLFSVLVEHGIEIRYSN